MQNNTIRIIWNLISAQVLGSINFGSGKKNKAILYLPFCAKKKISNSVQLQQLPSHIKAIENRTPFQLEKNSKHMWVFPNIMVPPNHPFTSGVPLLSTSILGIPIFGNTHMWLKECQDVLSVFLLVVCNFSLLKVSSQLLKQRIERSAGVAGKKKLAAGRQNSQYSDLQIIELRTPKNIIHSNTFTKSLKSPFGVPCSSTLDLQIKEKSWFPFRWVSKFQPPAPHASIKSSFSCLFRLLISKSPRSRITLQCGREAHRSLGLQRQIVSTCSWWFQPNWKIY